jgi:hypothetical protein
MSVLLSNHSSHDILHSNWFREMVLVIKMSQNISRVVYNQVRCSKRVLILMQYIHYVMQFLPAISVLSSINALKQFKQIKCKLYNYVIQLTFFQQLWRITSVLRDIKNVF